MRRRSLPDGKDYVEGYTAVVSVTAGQIPGGPGFVLREALSARLIESHDAWLQLLRVRTQTEHAYLDDIAKTVYERISTGYSEMQASLARLGPGWKRAGLPRRDLHARARAWRFS